MNHARSLIAEAAAALVVHNDGTFSWFGERFPGGPPERLLAAVTRRLYLDFFTQGRAAPTLDRRLSPARRGRADLADALVAANHGTGSLQPGWLVQGEEPDRLVVRGAGLTLWVTRAEFVPDAREAIRPGCRGSIRLPRQVRERSPGHYTALGDRGLSAAGEALVRVYWSLLPAGAPAAMSWVTAELNAVGIPFEFKVLHDSSDFTRCDAGVLYVPRARARVVFSVARGFARSAPHTLRDRVPALTRRIDRGVAYAEEPLVRWGFGLHRCRLIADALLSSWRGGPPSPEIALAAVEASFRAEGVSVDAPHRARSRRDGDRLAAL